MVKRIRQQRKMINKSCRYKLQTFYHQTILSYLYKFMHFNGHFINQFNKHYFTTLYSLLIISQTNLININYPNIMKNTHTKSFRVQQYRSTSQSFRKRLSTTHNLNSLQQDEFKQSAINSIWNGIKNANLGKITKLKTVNLQTQPSMQMTDNLLVDSLRNKLLHLKAKYDNIYGERNVKTNKIDRLKVFELITKEEVEKYKVIQNDLKNKIGEPKQKLSKIMTQDDNKNELKSAINDYLIYQNVKKRLQSDCQCYKQRRNNLKIQLNNLKSQLGRSELEYFKIKQYQSRSNKLYRQMKDTLDEENQSRQQSLNYRESDIEKKKQFLVYQQIHQQELVGIAKDALLQKDKQQKQLIKLFMANKFASNILRQKIKNQMEKYKIVENAFLNIKAKTAIADIGSFLSKFLQKEQLYGDLLTRIAQNEKTIRNLKTERQSLLEDYIQLESLKQSFKGVKIKQTSLDNQFKQLQFYNKKTSDQKNCLYKLKSWTKRQLKKISKLTINQNQYKKLLKEKKGSQTQQDFINYLKILSTLVDQCNKKQINLYMSDGIQVHYYSLNRVKPNNQSHDNNYEVDQDFNSNYYGEEQTLRMQRQQVIRKNQVFMKEVKKRRYESRKYLSQKIDKIKK